MLSTTSREALREALVGVSTPKVEALILLNALPVEDLPEIIQIMRRMIGMDDSLLQ
jgi:hypothetical protein